MLYLHTQIGGFGWEASAATPAPGAVTKGTISMLTSAMEMLQLLSDETCRGRRGRLLSIPHPSVLRHMSMGDGNIHLYV